MDNKNFCKKAPSGRCVKTVQKKEDDPSCLYKETTKRCGKRKETTMEKPKQKASIGKTKQKASSIGKTKIGDTIPFQLNPNAESIEFTAIPEKFFLKNSLNSTHDLNLILEHLKLPKMKSKNQKSLQIRKYISTVFQKFPLEKIGVDTVQLVLTPQMKVVYQYKQCKKASLYEMTLLLLYFNINKYISPATKNNVCQMIEPLLPIDKKQIEKSFFQTLSKKKNFTSLPVKEIDSILSRLDIEKTNASKSEKCSILLHIDKIYKADKSKAYIILDDEHVLFLTDPKRILYNIYHNILQHKNLELSRIVGILQKHGLLPDELYKIPLVGGYNKLVKNVVVTKKNFPKYIFPQQLEEVPKTPFLPSLFGPKQYYLTHKAFLKLSNKMKNCVTVFKKKFESEKYNLIDLVPPENRMKNGRDIRMYHGTKLLHWKDIKEQGIKPIGGGTLGTGFYFTPSVSRATDYLFRDKKQQKQLLTPVLIELLIKGADKLTVGDLKSKCPIKTNPRLPDGNFYYWQFIVTSPSVIQNHFRIDRVFKLDT